MAHAERVDLAHEPDFVLGRLTVSPARRELTRDDGEREVLEHRVMQVLIALRRAGGGIVTRDELTMSCWEGRVVGEDAITRVISRLRKSAEGVGAGSFAIETITKIGYRMKGAEGAAPADPAPVAPAAGAPDGPDPVAVPAGAPTDPAHVAPPPVASGTGTTPSAPRLGRRTMLAGGAAAGALALAGGLGWFYSRSASPALPPGAEDLMRQAAVALEQDTREGQNQAIGLYRGVLRMAPDYADGWGQLGFAYSLTSHYRPKEEGQAMTERAEEAARRALQLDRDNGYGALALAWAKPLMEARREKEQALRRVLTEHPGNGQVRMTLGFLLAEAGRFTDAIALREAAPEKSSTPSEYFQWIQQFWSAGRLEEADRLMDEAASLYPTQFSIWFARFYIWMYSGRVGEAIALAEDRAHRPSGIPDSEIEDILTVARAVQNPAPATVEAVMQAQMQNARLGTGKAENTIQFACALGRIDDAFAVAEAYYFARGFAVPDVRFSEAQGTYSTPPNRLTRILFQPVTRPMRADPRFARLVAGIGLERYWKEAGVQPDYRRS